MIDFTNKVAVITGAASGIGKALAIECLLRKMKVILADINEEKLKQCVSELQSISYDCVSLVMDVGNEAQVKELAIYAMNTYGGIHFLFNNAGIPGALGPIWTQTRHAIQQVLQVNLLGTIYGIQAFVPVMLAQQEECWIINTSAGAGLLTGTGFAAYKASKHAIIAVSEVLFAELKEIQAKINVAVLIPHWVNTDMPRNIIADNPLIIEGTMEQFRNHGMPPAEVADKVFKGINEKRFYIFTHADEHLSKIRKRMENILTLQDPC